MNELDPSRTALLALDFQNYGIDPEGYWAKHGEPDWPAKPARPRSKRSACSKPRDVSASSSSTSELPGGMEAPT
jgi:nicotinamidase-related amidase